MRQTPYGRYDSLPDPSSACSHVMLVPPHVKNPLWT